jgi:hypothetical protein
MGRQVQLHNPPSRQASIAANDGRLDGSMKRSAGMRGKFQISLTSAMV